MIFLSEEDKFLFNESFEANVDSNSLEKWTKEASDKGLKYHFRDSKRLNNAWYELSCGHIKSVSVGDVRRGKFTCKECTTKKKYIENCERIGLTYISHYIKDTQSIITVRCNGCNEVSDRRVSSITHHNGIDCETCKIANWMSISSKYGFTFIEAIDAAFGRYECLECGNIDNKRFSDMRLGEVSCPCKLEVKFNSYKEEAFENGFEFIKKYSSNKLYLYKCFACGTIDSFQLGAMRIGNVRCRSDICGGGKKSRPQRTIEKYLIEKYDFFSLGNEVSFDDLRGFYKKKLRYDVGLHLKGKLLGLIEYDGEHHFHPVAYNSSGDPIANFLRTQIYDSLKNIYCERNMIPLLRISYLEFKDEDWKDKIDKYIEKEVLNYEIAEARETRLQPV